MSASLVDAALRLAELPHGILERQSMSGGCIHSVERLRLADRTVVVVKQARPELAEMLVEEADGLAALRATGTVRVPGVLGVLSDERGAAMVLEHLARGRADGADWTRFGRDLAALHLHPAGELYGFDCDNHLGTTRQPNAWHDDWPAFNASCRIGHQLRLLRERGSLDAAQTSVVEAVVERLPALLPARPRPSLLHGDLWSGNALAMDSGVVAVIDPAPSIGDGLADLAMMRLFGGFPPACFAGYFAAMSEAGEPPIPPRALQARIGAYQMYHVLNHATIFGGGYGAQAAALGRDLVALAGG